MAVTKPFGGKSESVVLPLLISHDRDLAHVFAVFRHEGHVAPIGAPFPSSESLEKTFSVVRTAHGFDCVDSYWDLPAAEADELSLPSRSAI